MTQASRPRFVHLDNISTSDGGSTVTVSQLKKSSPLRTNLIQYLGPPLRKASRHYLLRVEEIDSMQYIMMGLCRSCWPNSPSWDILHGIRYHSNDGGIFNGGPGQRSGFTYTKGDTVTCMVAYFGRTKCLVEYLKNTRYTYRNWVYLPDTELRPTIGFAQSTAKLTVEWSAETDLKLTVPVKLMTCWMGLEALARTKDNNIVKVTGWNAETDAKKHASLTAPKPFSRRFTYFEVEILTVRDQVGAIGIGHVPPVFTLSEFPGWPAFPRSVGYHSDDGGLHHNGKVSADEALKCKAGDVMGCGVVFGDVEDPEAEPEAEVVTTYFTKNGQLVYQRTSRISSGGCYPCVTFQSNEASVIINTDARSKVPTDDMARALNTLNVDTDLICGEQTTVTKSGGWLCSVQAMASGNNSFVQMTTWPLEEELQRFSVTSDKLGSSGEILVGVAAKMEAATGRPQWLCYYNMTSGKIFMPEGLRLTSEHSVVGEAVTCMVDYVAGDRIFVAFLAKDRILGRAAFKKDSPATPVCATVALTGAGMAVQVNWAALLFPPCYRDPKDPPLSQWLLGDESKIHRGVGSSESVFGKSTSMQSPSHFTMSLPYVEFKLNGPLGHMPTVGLSTAVSDLYSLVGEKAGEIIFDVFSGEIITKNEIVHQASAWIAAENLTSVGVGLVFTKSNTRAAQDVVVYFTRNNLPMYQRVMSIAAGGAYPTITFPREGCHVEVNKGVYPQLTDHMMVAWVENMKTNAQNQDTAASSGTFSSFITSDFSQRFKPAFPKPAKDDEDKGRTEDEDTPAVAPPAIVKELRGNSKIVERGKIFLDKDGEAFVVGTDEEGQSKNYKLVAKDKSSLPDNSSPTSSAATSGVPAKSENTESKAETKPVEAETKPVEAETKPAEAETKPAEAETKPVEVQTKPAESLEPPKDNESSESTTAEDEAAKTKKPVSVLEKVKKSEPTAHRHANNREHFIISHQSRHARDNVRTIPKPAVETDETDSDKKAETTTNTTTAVPSSEKTTKSIVLAHRNEEDEEPFFLGHQSMHTDDMIPIPAARNDEADENEADPSQDQSKNQSPVNEDSPSSVVTSASPPPPSCASSRLSSAAADTERGLAEEEKGDAEPEVEDSNGGVFQVRDDIRNFAGVTNLLLDPGIMAHEKKLRNSLHIEALSESEAKKVLQTINEDMPQEMGTYLSPYDTRLMKAKRTNPATGETRTPSRAAATPDRQMHSSMSSSSLSSTLSRASRRSQRHNPSSKACLLS